jgi:hypothetical protein
VVGTVDEPGSNARRVRVERNIYRRPSGVYEVGFKDAGGKQRWRTVTGGITAARALRDELLARRGRGEHVVTDGRLRFSAGARRYESRIPVCRSPAWLGWHESCVPHASL